jgi:hypothetical protein
MVILDLILLKIANCALRQRVCVVLLAKTCILFSATHCDTLRHIATHCDTLRHIATHSTDCDTLRHIATHFDTKTQTHCDTKRHTRVLYNKITVVVYFLTIDPIPSPLRRFLVLLYSSKARTYDGTTLYLLHMLVPNIIVAVSGPLSLGYSFNMD